MIKRLLSPRALTRTVAAMVLGASALAVLPAHAEGFYAGANLGHPEWRDDVNGIDRGDSGGVAGKAYGGYAFNPNFALEAGAMSLGHLRDGPDEAKAHGVFLDAVGTLPVAQDWSVLGRVGVANTRFTTDNGDDHGTGLKFGAGVQYDLSKTTALRGEWEHYRPEAFGDHSNLDQYTVGVKFNF